MSLNKDVALKTIHYNTNKKTHNEIKNRQNGFNIQNARREKNSSGYFSPWSHLMASRDKPAGSTGGKLARVNYRSIICVFQTIEAHFASVPFNISSMGHTHLGTAPHL